MNSLGLQAYYQGRYRDAEELLLRSLESKEKLAGPKHPDLAATLTNLGAVYRAEARYPEAEAVLERALAIAHPDMAGTMLEYARLLRVMKRKQEAARMEAQARSIAGFRTATVDVSDLR